MWDKTLTAQENILMYAVGFIVITAIALSGLLFNSVIYSIIIFTAYAATNAILEIVKRKTHAPDVWKIPGFVMCIMCSSLIVIMTTWTLKYSTEIMPLWQSIILGLLIIIFSAIAFSRVFYFKPKGSERNYQPIIDKIRINTLANVKPEWLIKLEHRVERYDDIILSIVYKQVFIENRTYTEVAQLNNMQVNQIYNRAKTIVEMYAVITSTIT